MSELLFAIGLTAIFLGLILVIVGLFLEFTKSEKRRAEEEENRQGEQRSEYGGVIFIGPIPIVFGSNKKIAKTMLILGIIIFIIFLILTIVITYL
ncbi:MULTISPECIES: TIGR00304 family membrane protein [Sulfurisphaera]|uniref:TIGR00304 family protein n=2 Tax=Sulfurisphaera tokodaii TaxID=111955 RepID=Q96YC7_SULTO|nr:DUF131 domain-containing protein [Sulfurisphaera tokodaii]BAB67350.1 hypothetical protein STK_22405 [Sulfurisphaera tokodaii str. 7]HII73160.1 DUF131 domain-containing protein [Sulfurisphaera tokodaii]